MRRSQNLPADNVKDYDLTLKDMKLGTITLLEDNRTPPQGVVESLNMMQIQDGVWARKWGSDYYSVALPSIRQGSPVVSTNLVANPSMETNITGYFALGPETLSQSTTQAFVGTHSLKVITPGTTQGCGYAIASITALSNYVASAYVWMPVGVAFNIQLDEFAGVSFLQSDSRGGYVGTGAWQRINVVVHTQATTNNMNLVIKAATATTFYVDAVMLEKTATLSDYFSGTTADTAAIDYAWTGATDASTSTRSVYVYAPYDLDGAFEVANPDGTTEILEVAGGVIYRSSNGGSKTVVTLTNGSLTTGKKCYFLQIRGFVYIGNGFNPIVRYDNNAKTATGYTALSTPIAATAAKTGLTGTTYNYYYVIVASNLVGTTVGSPEVTVQVGKLRDVWAGSVLPNTTDLVTLTITRVTNATRYSIFITDQSGYELYLDSVQDPGSGTTFTYVDDGTVAVNEFVELPNDNTTGGPKLTQMELSDNRVWALEDENPWRVDWAGVGQYTGIFSPFYGGGYVDLELGGRERPKAVVHYRDGKGNATATVLTTDPEGNGSTWQITLDTVTVGTTSFIVPNPVKIVGSIGCSSSRGWAKVGNDIIFGNHKGAFSLGSIPSVVNVLSTLEISANVRKSPIPGVRGWRDLAANGMDKFAMYNYDAKVFCAVPNGSSGNNEIWVRSVELRNWQLAWTGVAVASFFEYTDSSGRNHLLAVPVSGSRLIEISPDIQGDFGEAFPTRIKTGIIPVDKNHNKFAQINNIFLEAGRPVGKVHIDAYGYDYKKGFIFLGGFDVIGATSSSIHWGQPWSSTFWSHLTEVPIATAPSVERKRKRINNLVNNMQFVVTTTGLTDYYELLEMSGDGYLVDVDPPPLWKVGTNSPSIDRITADTLLDETGAPILDETGDPLLV